MIRLRLFFAGLFSVMFAFCEVFRYDGPAPGRRTTAAEDPAPMGRGTTAMHTQDPDPESGRSAPDPLAFDPSEPVDALAWTMYREYPYPLPVVRKTATHVCVRLPGVSRLVAVPHAKFVEPEFVRVPAGPKAGQGARP